jgi:hypothetical protein
MTSWYQRPGELCVAVNTRCVPADHPETEATHDLVTSSCAVATVTNSNDQGP